MVKGLKFITACLLSIFPGPPSIKFDDSILQLFPINKNKCQYINPKYDITFQIFTRSNPLIGQNLRIGDDLALIRSNMDFTKPTLFYFHAFLEDSTSDSGNSIKTAYLQQGDNNIILINAPRLEAGPWYLVAARNTKSVGRYSAIFIDYLVSRGLNLDHLHLVGHSLGAHMAGVAGNYIKSGKINRITGLDPAKPGFINVPLDSKLDKTDAKFVDIIHTDSNVFGYGELMGHADFWPNGGVRPQPGCLYKEVKKQFSGIILPAVFCSHWRSYQYFSESILKNNSFIATPCQSWNNYTKGFCNNNAPTVSMGFYTSNFTSGRYFLHTRDFSPFSLN